MALSAALGWKVPYGPAPDFLWLLQVCKSMSVRAHQMYVYMCVCVLVHMCVCMCLHVWALMSVCMYFCELAHLCDFFGGVTTSGAQELITPGRLRYIWDSRYQTQVWQCGRQVPLSLWPPLERFLMSLLIFLALNQALQLLDLAGTSPTYQTWLCRPTSPVSPVTWARCSLPMPYGTGDSPSEGVEASAEVEVRKVKEAPLHPWGRGI